MRLNHEIFFLSCVFCSFHVVFFCTIFFRSVIEGRSGTVAVDLVEVVFIDRRERGRPIFLDMEVSQVCWKSLVTSHPWSHIDSSCLELLSCPMGCGSKEVQKSLHLAAPIPFPTDYLIVCSLVCMFFYLSPLPAKFFYSSLKLV